MNKKRITTIIQYLEGWSSTNECSLK
jgi:hypothetical protein